MIFSNKSDNEFKRKCKTVSTDLHYLQIVVTCNVFNKFVSFFGFWGFLTVVHVIWLIFHGFWGFLVVFSFLFHSGHVGCGDDIYMLRWSECLHFILTSKLSAFILSSHYLWHVGKSLPRIWNWVQRKMYLRKLLL